MIGMRDVTSPAWSPKLKHIRVKRFHVSVRPSLPTFVYQTCYITLLDNPRFFWESLGSRLIKQVNDTSAINVMCKANLFQHIILCIHYYYHAIILSVLSSLHNNFIIQQV